MLNQLISTKTLTFHPFPRLPLEVRLIIWNYAVEHKSQIIPFSLSDPNDGQVPTHGVSWKHMFCPPRSAPTNPLYHTCSESRGVFQSHKSTRRGFEANYNGGPLFEDDGKNHIYTFDRPRYMECQYVIDLDNYNSGLYWNPEIDVAFLQHDHEPNGVACDSRTMCKPHESLHSFVLDSKLKYMVITPEVYRVSGHGPQILAVGVEVVFLLMDKEASARNPESLFADEAFQQILHDLGGVVDLYTDMLGVKGVEDLELKLVANMDVAFEEIHRRNGVFAEVEHKDK